MVSILYVLLCSSLLAYGLEIVESPSDTTVFLGHTAEFICGTRGANYAFWRVNGTSYNDLPPELRDDLVPGRETVGVNEVYTLTIPGRAEYNETVVQCKAGDSGNGSIESANTTLKVQGLLTSVGNMKAENNSTSIGISWSAPSSLDVSGVDPDIWYTVLISNVTDEDHSTAVPCTDCHNRTQTHYTFSPDLPSPCHKYTFIVIPQNGAGLGDSSQLVTGYTIAKFPPNVNFHKNYNIAKVDNNYQITFNILEGDVKDVCRIILHVINPAISVEGQVLSGAKSVVYMIPQEKIQPDQTYEAKFEIITAAHSMNTTTYEFKTFDVNSATAISVDSGILVTGELIGNSHAMGCFVVVQCDERNSDRYQVLLRNGDESTVSATINVPSMDEVSHTVNVYDLEKDGLPNSMPAVEVDGIRVPPHDKDDDNINSTFLKRAEISKIGSEVNIICEFADGYQEASCVLIYHEYDKPNLTVEVFNNSFYVFPVTITVDDPDKYTFCLFGKNGTSAIEQEPVIRIKMGNHATYPSSGEDNGKDNSESDRVSPGVIAGVVTAVVIVLFGFAVVVVVVAKFYSPQSSNVEQRSYGVTSPTHTGEPKPDSDVTQGQVALVIEKSAGERFSITIKAGEREQSNHASVQMPTYRSGIGPSMMENPVQYDQIDINATKRKAHPYSLYEKVTPDPKGQGPKPNKMMDDPNVQYATNQPGIRPPPVETAVQYGQVDLKATKRKAAPVSEGQGPKPNKMVDDPNEQYAIILPHATSPTGSPNTESEEMVPKEKTLPEGPPTVKAVMTLLWCVEPRRWKEIADGFGINKDLVDEIFTNNELDNACLQDCVQKWMKFGPTWGKLATVLKGMGEESLAGQAASKDLSESSDETPPSASTESDDDGYLQASVPESESNGHSEFVASSNGQTPAASEDSNRGQVKMRGQVADLWYEARSVTRSNAKLQEPNDMDDSYVVLPESETSSSVECSSDEEDYDVVIVNGGVMYTRNYQHVTMQTMNSSVVPPIPSSYGLTMQAPQPCTDVTTEGALLTRAEQQSVAFKANIDEPADEMVSTSSNTEVMAVSFFPPEIPSTITEEPPNESHEEYIPPQQPPEDNPHEFDNG